MSEPGWASDRVPSVPVAPRSERLVKFGGFCFTVYGIAHDISIVEEMALRHPPIGPYGDGVTQ